MSSVLVEAGLSPTCRRYAGVEPDKAKGATYTPELLAGFVAEQILRAATPNLGRTIRILDPAVGDGALLDALIGRLPEAWRNDLEVVGFDTDANALHEARQKLARRLPEHRLRLEKRDFLSYVLDSQAAPDLLSAEADERFDLVIANPPYVRTQVMGAAQAQQIARTFGLSGRVDLYYPFVLGIGRVLAQRGTAGIITSNRFMTTKSGQAVRGAVLSSFDVLHAWDLGDTKLFDAAVLPAVLLVRGREHPGGAHTGSVRFSSVYETRDEAALTCTDPVAALAAQDDSVVDVPDGRRFRVRHGSLEHGNAADGVWRIATPATDTWLTTVQSHTWDTFKRIGKIRVGVKSTADKVFVRSDWDVLPGGRPELLRPLVTRHVARRYRAAVPTDLGQRKEILYPHEVTASGRRFAVDLARYPKAQRYLEAHRTTLEARTYVTAAGRSWYEIWVPQDPGAWCNPKLVFPDISDEPVFWMDMGGGVVNGECYWLQAGTPGDAELLWLALAVANSSFIVAFYDHRFHNKLYAGRRRFITQYVEQFPLPDPALPLSAEIVALTKRIYAITPSAEARMLEEQLDRLIWRVFGLSAKEIAA